MQWRVLNCLYKGCGFLASSALGIPADRKHEQSESKFLRLCKFHQYRRHGTVPTARARAMKYHRLPLNVDTLLTHIPNNPYSMKTHRNFDPPSWFTGKLGP